MSELTPKEPKTPEEKRARAHKIRTMVLDMIMPVLAALFLILAVIWPNSIMASLAGIFAGAVLIRFSVTRYQGERGMQVFDKLAMAGGIVLILLAAARLVLMGLIAAGVLERGVLPFPQLYERKKQAVFACFCAPRDDGAYMANRGGDAERIGLSNGRF